MIWEVRMPRLDDDMQEGTIVRWLKKEGDRVEKGEPIVEIETQKITYEIQAPNSGSLRLMLAKADELVPINTIIAVIADPDEDISSYLTKAKEKEKIEKAVSQVTPAHLISPSFASGPGEKERILISPIARKLAVELGIDISQVRGTGPGGRIIKEDVLQFKASKTETPARKFGRKVREILPFSGIRKAVADRMMESWQTSPRAENFMIVDVTELVKLREKYGEIWEKKHGIRPSVTDAIIVATAKALREFPMMNASLQEKGIELYEDINISVAVALEKGLITPVVREADTRDIFDIAKETLRLIELVRKGQHTAETLTDSTFTITNLGMYDVDVFVPIINPPECAILAVGKIEKKPVIIQDAIAIRDMMTLCLAYDHRVVDGAVAARFLQVIKKSLAAPISLLPEEP
jgi:pyruvate dehydrogenase E2 component (dihydrolipoamide acetyltransferase)